MLACIWDTMGEINVEALRRLGQNCKLGADVLLPLFEYVLIQSEIGSIRHILSYVEVQFYPTNSECALTE